MGIEEDYANRRFAQTIVREQNNQAYRDRMASPNRHSALGNTTSASTMAGAPSFGSGPIGQNWGWAVSQLLIVPNSTAIMSRMFVRAGVRTPREAMQRARALMVAAQLHFCVMWGTGMIAITCVVVGAGGVAGIAHHNPDYRYDKTVFYLIAIAVGLSWMWMMKVINGAILHYFVKDLPNPPYKYIWFAPVTVRSSLQLWRIPSVVRDKARTTKDRAITVFGIIMWAILVKLPLYGAITFMIWSLMSAAVAR